MYLLKDATNEQNTFHRIAKSQALILATIIAAGSPMIASADPGHTGPPITYGQWNATLDLSGKSVVNDTSVECGTAGWTCKTIAEDDGFLYQEVQTADGETYTRMINLDPGSVGDASTLGFSSESYTARQERNNNNDWTFADDNSLALAAQGLASRQIIRDGALDTTVELQNGFARGLMGVNNGVSTPADALESWCAANDPLNADCAKDLAQKGWNVKITQTIQDAELDSDFSNIIWYETPNNAFVSAIQTTIPRGNMLDIAQTVTDTASGGQEKFDIRKREGNTGYEWFCGGFFTCNPDYNLTTGGSVTLGGTTKTWAAEAFIRGLWIGSTMGGDAGFTLATANDTDTNGTGSGEAREVTLNAAPTSPDPSWLAGDPFYDLNWPVKTTNIPDPFAGHTGIPPRTAPPTF